MCKQSLLLMVTISGLLLTACENEEQISQAEVIRPVIAMRISGEDISASRKFPGQARAANDVVLAFEVPGKLNEIPVDVGDNVKQGQVLASLDPRDFRNALTAAEAEKKRAQANYQRVKNAAAQNAVSKQEVTNAEAAYEAAKADVKIKIKAQEDATLHAPYDAIVSEVYISSFENIQAKQRAMKLVDPRQIEMVVDISEDIINLVEPNLEVLVEFDALPGVIVEAYVSEIGAEASEVTRTYPVTTLMNQLEGQKIKPGMTGRAWPKNEVPGAGNTRGFEIPVTAMLQGKDGKSYIWLIDETTGQVSKKAVTSGEITKDGVLVEGVASGDVIATAGVNTLKQGQKVRIVMSAENRK